MLQVTFLLLLPFFGPLVAAMIYAGRAGDRYASFLEAHSDYRRTTYDDAAGRLPWNVYRRTSARQREADAKAFAGAYGDEGRDLLATLRWRQRLMLVAIFIGPLATVLLPAILPHSWYVAT